MTGQLSHSGIWVDESRRFCDDLLILLFNESCRCHCHGYGCEHSVFVIACFEKGVAQRDGIDAFHGRIFCELGVNEEEHRHIDRLACVEPLLFETEALDLAEVWCHLCWCHRVCSHPDDVCVALVLGSVEC